MFDNELSSAATRRRSKSAAISARSSASARSFASAANRSARRVLNVGANSDHVNARLIGSLTASSSLAA